MKRFLFAWVSIWVAACGDEATCPTGQTAFPDGDVNGLQPLEREARRARAAACTPGTRRLVPSGPVTWKDGDFVLANDKVALVIEDVGDSDLYDPWAAGPSGWRGSRAASSSSRTTSARCSS